MEEWTTNPCHSCASPCPSQGKQIPWSFWKHKNSQCIRSHGYQNWLPSFHVINCKHLQRRISEVVIWNKTGEKNLRGKATGMLCHTFLGRVSMTFFRVILSGSGSPICVNPYISHNCFLRSSFSSNGANMGSTAAGTTLVDFL